MFKALGELLAGYMVPLVGLNIDLVKLPVIPSLRVECPLEHQA
jgi:hypothetical protein